MNREIKFRAKIKDDAGIYRVWDIDWLNQMVRVERACGIEWVSLKKIEAFLQYTGLKDKNNLTDIYEGDIIGVDGTIRGNIYEDERLLQDTTNLVIEGLGSKAWRTTEKKAVDRGCKYTE